MVAVSFSLIIAGPFSQDFLLILSLFILIFYTNQSLGNDLEIQNFIKSYDKSNSIILDGSLDSEINSPLIKIDEDIENPIPPKAE